MKIPAYVQLLLVTTFLTPAMTGADGPSGVDSVTLSEATTDQNGFLTHKITSPYQAGTTEIKVLVPDNVDAGRRYPVVYVLPVEAGSGDRWGNGLLEVKRAGLHNEFGAICVAPTFSHLPWYADHPTDSTIRQESYLLKVVVPLVERTYPAQAGPSGRLLVGFSKSGWGALSLLLRHGDVFGRAAAWDAPLMMAEPNRYGMGPIFGSQENFEQYRISRLLQQAGKVSREKRLVLLGHGSFKQHHDEAHALMERLKIPHVYREGPKRRHAWDSGWLPEAVGFLCNGPEP